MAGALACSTPPSAPASEAPTADASTSTSTARLTPEPWRPAVTTLCPEVEPDETSLRFGTRAPLECPRPNTCRSNPKLLDASAQEIRAYLGVPLRCEGERWTYRLNGTCNTEHDLLHLLVVEGRVEEVEHEHHFASVECPPGPGDG